MKSTANLVIIVLALALMVYLAEVIKADTLGTAWTYQGRLIDTDGPAEGLYDFMFGLFDGPEGLGELGVQVIHDLDVIDGYFTVNLDFGSDVFDGSERWLQIEIRPGELHDPNEYTMLNPRQRIGSTPYALQTRGVFVDDVPYIIDYPDTWTPKESDRTWRSVAMSADGTKQTAVGNNLLIYVSTDSGNTWTPKESYRWWYSVAMSADGAIQTAVAYAGKIYVSTDSGNTWTPKDSDRYWRSVAMSADGTKQTAVGLQGQIYVSTDSGNNWAAKESNRDWYSVAMSADGTKQTAVGQNTQIYVSTDSGNTWTAKESNRYWWSVAMSADGTKQTAVVVGGQIYVSMDSGNTWTAKEFNRNWYSVTMSADGTKQTAVVAGGQIYVSMDSGNTWTAKESNRQWYSVAMSEDGTKQTAVVDQGQIYICSAVFGSNYNVGLGIISPTAKLHIGGTPGVDGIMFPDGSLQTSAGGAGSGDGHSLDAADGNPLDVVYVDNEGNVSIGMTNPISDMQVRGYSSGPIIRCDNDGSGHAIWGESNVGDHGVLGHSSAGVFGYSESNWGIYGYSSENRGVYGNGSPGVRGESSNGDGIVGWTGSTNKSGVFGDSQVGTGVTGRSEAASGYGVAGVAPGSSGRGVYGNATGNDGVGVYGRSDLGRGVEGRTTSNNEWVSAIYGSNVGAGDGVYGWSQNRHGIYGVTQSSTHAGVYGINQAGGYAGVFDGTVKTNVLEITGGSDLSEKFEIRALGSKLSPLPGMVVSIDSENPGDLVVSNEAYDRKVAGIMSGAGGVKPGMLMGQHDSKANGTNPVALTGRVYCWADASYGEILPGDLLTTSDTPGHAMKVKDYTKAQGAILGKAMTGLNEEKGLVLVLVTLQ